MGVRCGFAPRTPGARPTMRVRHRRANEWTGGVEPVRLTPAPSLGNPRGRGQSGQSGGRLGGRRGLSGSSPRGLLFVVELILRRSRSVRRRALQGIAGVWRDAFATRLARFAGGRHPDRADLALQLDDGRGRCRPGGAIRRHHGGCVEMVDTTSRAAFCAGSPDRERKSPSPENSRYDRHAARFPSR